MNGYPRLRSSLCNKCCRMDQRSLQLLRQLYGSATAYMVRLEVASCDIRAALEFYARQVFT